MKPVRSSARAGFALPEGRAGQAAAAAVTLFLIIVLAFGIIAPARSWYAARTHEIAAKEMILAHEQALAASLPALRTAIIAMRHRDAGFTLLLTGGSDAVAGAAFQGQVQALANSASISLDSAELLPPKPIGGFRRIPLRVTMTTTYPQLIALLGAIAAAQPRMLADDLSLHATGITDPGHDLPLRASFTVAGFRAANQR
jgi:general secretion pathway protein M